MTEREVKNIVRERDGHRCTECGVTGKVGGRKLDVHRIVPGSAYTVDGCVTLCRDCHIQKPRSASGSVRINGMARSIVFIPASYRTAVCLEARERHCTTSDIIVEMIEGNSTLTDAIERIRQKRAAISNP